MKATGKLSDIYDFQYGKGNDNPDNGGIYPVYGSNGIIGGYDKYNNEDSPVIGHIGANAGIVVFAKGKHFVTYNGVMCKIKDCADKMFGYYALLFSNLKSIAFGSAQPFISYNTLNRIPIYLPSIDKQKKISSILSAYDNLIEVNNKRIKILEQMAENLYNEWFVRFRFPGYKSAEFVNSDFGYIPSSFSIIKMQDAFDYYIGGGWGNDDEDKDFSVGAYVIRGTDFPRVAKGDISSCPFRYHKTSNYAPRELKADDIIIEVSGGTAEQPVGRALIVTEEVLERLGNKVICASFCKQVRVNKDVVSPVFFYYWMRFLYETRIIDRFQLQSTGIINFQFEYFLRKGKIMLPPKDIMNAFESRIRLFHKEIASLAKQNENLIKQRDLLLPRLMSGKLGV